ncbi:hypothetical protein OTK49_03355 [Vibrio coralliirubri]|uniref:hypothetical protein n=1 Tax=Vibrio coralliirubri TaxID=1516159 RepID=UPI002283AB6F|nr:hypothetical protein [Vibrio coralliirubri]MCY9861554.1 hypothetical protein [Vibrio coralliirubri]
MSKPLISNAQQAFLEYVRKPMHADTSWRGMFQLSDVFLFDGEMWAKNPTVAAIRFSGDVIELASRGIISGDNQCIDELNVFLSKAPITKKMHIKDALEEVSRNISLSENLPHSYKEAALRLKVA